MHYIFPDTNIFIHGKDFEEINWSQLIDRDKVTIMLTGLVISELDKHKYNAKKRISQRARKLLPKFESLIEKRMTSKVSLELILKKPSEETFVNNGLDKKDQDDTQLATIIEFMNKMDKSDTIILVTNDTGPRLKAKLLSIPTCKLPEEYMLDEELDDNEIKIKTLQKELVHFKNKNPVLSLCFEDDQSFMVVDKIQDVKSESEYIEQEFEKVNKEFQPLIYKEDNNEIFFPNVGKIRMPSYNLSEVQVNTYNDKLTDYFNKYKIYLSSKYNYLVYKHNCVALKIVIKNTGFTPATDVDIHLHFPDGFDIIDEDEFPELLKEPNPPFKPSHLFDIEAISPEYLQAPIFYKSNFSPGLSIKSYNISSPSIKRTNSYDVSFYAKTVKHNQKEELDILLIKFADIRIAHGFTIDYKIMAANIPNVITGKLNVNILKNDI